MEFKIVLGVPEDDMYILEMNGMYYFVNLSDKKKPSQSKYIDTFLRFVPDMEEIKQVPEKVQQKLQERMNEYFK